MPSVQSVPADSPRQKRWGTVLSILLLFVLGGQSHAGEERNVTWDSRLLKVLRAASTPIYRTESPVADTLPLIRRNRSNATEHGGQSKAVNLAVLPVLGIFFFLVAICVKACSWFREHVKEKEVDECKDYEILTEPEEGYKDVEFRSDTSSVYYDTVSSYRSILRQKAGYYNNYDTVTSIRSLLQRAEVKDAAVQVKLHNSRLRSGSAGRGSLADAADNTLRVPKRTARQVSFHTVLDEFYDPLTTNAVEADVENRLFRYRASETRRAARPENLRDTAASRRSSGPDADGGGEPECEVLLTDRKLHINADADRGPKNSGRIAQQPGKSCHVFRVMPVEADHNVPAPSDGGAWGGHCGEKQDGVEAKRKSRISVASQTNRDHCWGQSSRCNAAPTAEKSAQRLEPAFSENVQLADVDAGNPRVADLANGDYESRLHANPSLSDNQHSLPAEPFADIPLKLSLDSSRLSEEGANKKTGSSDGSQSFQHEEPSRIANAGSPFRFLQRVSTANGPSSGSYAPISQTLAAVDEDIRSAACQ